MEEIVEMLTPSPSRIQMVTPPIVLGDEYQVDTGKGKLNNGTSDETVARRELSSRLLDDRSTSVDLALKPHRVLVTRSLPFSGRSLSGLPFSGGSPGGSHSLSRPDLYLNRSAAKSGVLLPTILEGTPLESSAMNMKLEPREFFVLDSIEHEEVVGVGFDGVDPDAMCKLPPLEVPYSNQVEVLSGGLTPEAMVGRFCSDEAEWYTFHPRAPEAMVKNEDDWIAEREKVNIEEPAPEAMCKINKEEVPGSRKVECLKIRPIAPEAMTKFNIEKYLSEPEAMFKYAKAKKRVAECSTIPESAPEAMTKSDKGGCLESEKGNVWKTHSSAPEAMPKVGISRGINMNTSKLHKSHPRVPERLIYHWRTGTPIAHVYGR
jgi:hypothetical protein